MVSLKLVVGLGNPGERYADTRHNIGFMVASLAASRAGIALKRQGYQGVYGVGRLAGEEATVLLPQTFMNRSGTSVASACQALGIKPGDLVVVHDEIDLPFGTLRIKVGGGHGGHNGLRSLTEVLGGGDFIRIRIGIGRPPAGGDVSGYVLSRFASAERQALPELLGRAVTAVEMVMTHGPVAAMNEFNGRENVV